jgi:hypothetical protein
MRIAITGHRNLDGPTTVMVDNAIRRLLGEFTDVVGISCLAAGADQIFARAVLDMGGRLEVVIPAFDYATTLGVAAHRRFEELKGRAFRIQEPAHETATPNAYLDAGLLTLRRLDRLIAVWDGRPAAGVGGTAEIVEHARRRGIEVHRIWPEGAARVG